MSSSIDAILRLLPKIGYIVATIAAIITAYATLAALRLQQARAQAKVLFSLKREGNRIIPELKNIGVDIAREVKVIINPPLTVVEDIDKHYPGDRRLVTCSTLQGCIHTLLPGQVVTDQSFSVNAFRNQFTTYATLVVSISYYSGKSSKALTDVWHIDIAPLTRWEPENDEASYQE